MIDLYDYSIFTVLVAVAALSSAAIEIGWRLGLRHGAHVTDNTRTLESAMLGLLALIVGFTFAMALSRFDARRDAVVSEANAIGTTALRARLLQDPYRAESLRLLKEYVDIRVDIARRKQSLADITTAIDRSNVLQEALWQQAKAAISKDNSIRTGLFIQALNEMIDDQGKRLAALRNRIPNIVLLALSGIAAITIGFTGYASSPDTNRTRLPAYIMALVISVVILLIMDIDRPDSGFITTNQQPMIDTAASIAAFSD